MSTTELKHADHASPKHADHASPKQVDRGSLKQVDHASLVKASDMHAEATFSEYMNMLLTITSSSSSPTNIVIYVGGIDSGKPVIFSLGDERKSSAGMQVSMVGAGTMPMSSIDIKPNAATLKTASSGGGGNQWTLQIQGYLAAQSKTEFFAMSAIATDNATSVQVSLNNAGNTPLVQTPTSFLWE